MGAVKDFFLMQKRRRGGGAEEKKDLFLFLVIALKISGKIPSVSPVSRETAVSVCVCALVKCQSPVNRVGFQSREAR